MATLEGGEALGRDVAAGGERQRPGEPRTDERAVAELPLGPQGSGEPLETGLGDAGE